MNVAIVGYRNYHDYDDLESKILGDIDITDIKLIISGGCKGTDKLAETFAKKYSIPIKIHYPDWKTHGLAAGPMRNRLIVNDATHICAFLSPHSKGTVDSVNYAKKCKKTIFLYNI